MAFVSRSVSRKNELKDITAHVGKLNGENIKVIEVLSIVILVWKINTDAN